MAKVGYLLRNMLPTDKNGAHTILA